MSVLSSVVKEGVTPLAASEDRTAFSRFWRTFRESGWAIVKINLMALLFALPAIAWYMVMEFAMSADTMLVPYSANVGIGIHVVTDAVEVGLYRAFTLQVRRWLVMIPLMMIAFMGLAGTFYTMKALVRGEENVAKLGTFFRGIKKCWLPFLIVSLPVSLAVSATVIAVSAYPVYTQYSVVARVFAIIGVALVLFLIVLFSLFATTLSMTYDMKFGAIMKNSALFSVALIHRSIVVIAICALPVVLSLVLSQFLAMLFIVFFMLIGIAFLVLICTTYTQWAFDKFIEAPLRADKKAQKNKKKGAAQNV